MVIYLQTIDAPGDRDKLEVLYKEYRSLMFYIANKILGNEKDAEDAVHAAFVSIAENIERISDPLCPKTRGYIVTIVERKAIDLYRRKARHPQSLFEEEIGGLTVEYDTSHAIARCFSLLPAQARHILLLKYRYGYSAHEISKMLRISEASVAKRLQRAKEKLEQLCKEEGLL